MSKIHLAPEVRPREGEFCPKREVNYEIIIDWEEDGLTVNLYIRHHEEYPNIIPADATECDQYDSPTTPSVVEDLPDAHFQHQVNDIVRILKEKYTLREDDDTAICKRCYTENGDTYLHFTQRLTT